MRDYFKPGILLFTLLAFLFTENSFSDDRFDRKKMSASMKENDIIRTSTSYYTGPGLILEGYKYGDGGGFMVQPERQTGLSGFYDWQTNGECKRHVYYVSPDVIHATMMTAFDSTMPDPSRRTVYTFSSDGGVSWWPIPVEVPNVRSGFAFLTAGNTGQSNGAAIIANHYNSPLRSYVHFDAFPGLGAFTSNPGPTPRFYIWPQANVMSNGNILVTANIYENSIELDTIIMKTFNPNASSWEGVTNYFSTGVSNTYFSRWTSATGPDGKGLIVISPPNETGGSFFGSRIFYWTTNDYGNVWSGPSVLFDTQIDQDGDTSKPWVGLDAVYDDFGNFYVSFNTTSLTGSYSSAKIWINRNGTQNKVIARNTDIPGSMQTAATPQANVCSMDWPSLATTENGHFVVCAYSVAKQNDIVNGFNSMDVYFSLVTAGLSVTGQPHAVTSGTNDERFVSLNRTVIDNYKIPLVYQKDPQPGSSSYSDVAPVSRASLVYREIDFLNPLSGVEFTSSTAPNNYTLYQNYPNPFNPSTNIKFDIPKSGNVRITVYDITGKQIAELLNQNLSPGTYETNWDADGFGSGVYFYSLEAEGFKETRKMLLIK